MNASFKNISEEKRKRVVEVAFKEFALKGFENASTNRIVNTLGISKGSLFKYFSTKLGLYTYLVNIAVERLLKHMEEHEVKGDKWKERLLNYASIEFDFLIKEPIVYRFFSKMVSELEHPQLKGVRDELYKTANAYLIKIYSSINLTGKDDELLMLHISFVLKGYNEHFLKSTSAYEMTEFEKKIYLSGLKKHLNLIRRIT